MMELVGAESIQFSFPANLKYLKSTIYPADDYLHIDFLDVPIIEVSGGMRVLESRSNEFFSSETNGDIKSDSSPKLPEKYIKMHRDICTQFTIDVGEKLTQDWIDYRNDYLAGFEKFAYLSVKIDSIDIFTLVEENLHKMRISELTIDFDMKDLDYDRKDQWMYSIKTAFLGNNSL